MEKAVSTERGTEAEGCDWWWELIEGGGSVGK